MTGEGVCQTRVTLSVRVSVFECASVRQSVCAQEQVTRIHKNQSLANIYTYSHHEASGNTVSTSLFVAKVEALSPKTLTNHLNCYSPVKCQQCLTKVDRALYGSYLKSLPSSLTPSSISVL